MRFFETVVVFAIEKAAVVCIITDTVLMSCIDVTEFSRQKHWTAEKSFLSPFIVYAACAYFEKVWGVWRKGWESVGDGCGEVRGRCREVCGGDGTCGKMRDRCGKVCWGVGKGRCGEVCWRCRELLGKVWGSVCWRCGEVCWGVGGDVRKCWERCGGVGKCVGVWGEVWKSIGEGVGKI